MPFAVKTKKDNSSNSVPVPGRGPTVPADPPEELLKKQCREMLEDDSQSSCEEDFRCTDITPPNEVC